MIYRNTDKLFGLFFLLILFFMMLSIVDDVSAVPGDTIYVNGSSGNDTHDGLTWQTAKQSIGNGTATVSDNGVVNVANGVYSGVNNTNITISRNMTINGQSQAGTIINGTNTAQIFLIMSGVSVKILNLTLTNGNSMMGGAIFNEGNLTVEKCTFTHNNATGGGAISNYLSNSSSVINTVTDCTFTGNTANAGAAVLNAGDVGSGSGSIINTVDKCTFYGNTATSDGVGGAIYNACSGYCTIISTLNYCNFTDNTASVAGAVFNHWGGGSGSVTSTMEYCNFTGNTASGGGAIYNNCEVTSGSGSVINTVTDCTFSSNSADIGGAILNTSGGFIGSGSVVNTVKDSIFTDNTATNTGGAITNECIIGFLNNTVEKSTFVDNCANSGGAIFNQCYVSSGSGSASCTITDCNFINNTAEVGGAIFNICDGNTGSYSANINITSCNFTNNTATSGGAFANTRRAGSVTGSVKYCNFTGNTADLGGAIYNSGSGNFAKCTIDVHFNRIKGNGANEVFCDYGNFNADNNWWGDNNGPAGKIICILGVDKWLVLNITVSPTTIPIGGTSTISTDLQYDNYGTLQDPSLGHVPDGIIVNFNTTLGIINSPVSTVNGAANTTLKGGSVIGVAYVSATVDNQTVHTSVTIDATPPTVISTNPAQYAVNLPSNQVFTVTYSEPIKAGNLNLVVLKTSTGTIIATTKTITGNVLTITPNSALGEAKYLLLLYAGSVTDLAGNPAAALSRTYGVGAQPYVTSTNPANYAVNVPRNTAITATFNEPILAKYLTLIYLKTATGGIVVATTKSVSGNVLTITLTTPLAAGTRYMLMIYTFAVTDLAGNSNVNKAISFTTGAT